MTDWKAIRDEWETNDITFRELAEKHGINQSTVRNRKAKEGWERKISVKRPATKTGKKVSKSKRQKTKTKKERELATTDGYEIDLSPDLDLNDKQQMFCYYYLKNFNAKLAAINAGYSPDSAHVTGYKLLANPKIAAEVNRLKAEMRQGIFIDAMDILHKYIAIAFADITDFAWFGKKEVDVMSPFGPVRDEDGSILRKEINFVDFKDSEYVDGSLITEVKQGKEGIVVKLADKMEALKFLSKHFDMIPDQFKRRLEEEKLRLQYDKLHGTESPDNYEDDGFNAALDSAAKGVWANDAADGTSSANKSGD